MDIVYSIGHSNHETERLVALLQAAGANLVLDVRSAPYSQRYPQFNREALSRDLSRQGIGYEWFGQWFGARQAGQEFYTPAGWLNYAWFTASDIFAEGIARLDQALVQGLVPSLLCAEKDPYDCHRAIMVCRALAQRGYEPRHILADGSLQTQAELDLRLLDKYFPDRDAADIFSLIEGEPDPEEILAEAYLKRNEAIAWRLETMED